ncbi:SDR family oxidoreductase [Saccharopolyspora sp. HNM0983]|uniref:SDR family oxidoreductase n=1 Tax=Saccharopolyspora montiporae TaxID=2781240 RepID=A0A929FYS7_9PSEU|nr:SDR family oxidoreductase [Saccharopolyspora sp. HNM0983]MBE9373790.1 SDR family oxidoreductase [Saccharopolyspora sp. HNM0983]
MSGPRTGQVAVVTGSSSGVGRAVAEHLAAEGAAVVINGRDADAAHRAAAELAAGGARVRAVPGSAADPAVAEELVAAAEQYFGPVDALVNCAGTAEPAGSSILDISTEQWHELLESHLTSAFVPCRAVVPGMVSRGRGAIVNTGSHASTGAFGGTGYPAGKGGVNALTRALAAELREFGIRVNAVCPGARTRLSTGSEYEQHIGDLQRRGMLDEPTAQEALHPAEPRYVAPLYGYLVSDLAAGVSGEIFAAAGGFLGRFPRPAPELLAWRDAAQHPPWTPDDVAHHMTARRDTPS